MQMKTFSKFRLSPLWFYRLVRWGFGGFFIVVGAVYEGAWAAYIFGALFIITSFLKPTRCVGNDCSIK